MRRFILVCVGVMCGAMGCTHVEYSRLREQGSAVLAPDEFGAPRVDHQDYKINEILWLDPTGVVCAGAQTGLDEYGSAKSARDEAIEDRKSSYTYEYNIYAPVAGMYCGTYYRWGEGTTVLRDSPPMNAIQMTGDVTTESKTTEAGFHVEGIDQLERFNWITYSFGFELGMGRYSWPRLDGQTNSQGEAQDTKSPFTFRVPMWVGFGFFPTFLYGFGAQFDGGADLITWALTSGNGEFYKKFDYDVRLTYQFKGLDPFIFSASAGYFKDNLNWGEYWLQRRGPYGNVAASFVF
jgi:hypothetical protein